MITKFIPWNHTDTTMVLQATGGEHLPDKIEYLHNDTIYQYIRKVIKTKQGNIKK